MIEPSHLRSLIADTLKAIRLYSPEAVELLMLTAAQESHCGRYLTQVGDGPARGIFQMEPRTHQDLYENFLRFKPELVRRITWVCPDLDESNLDLNLRGNLIYQIVVSRLQYYRFSEPIPTGNDIEALARYYKLYWNTKLGKATVEEALANYSKYAV